MDNDATTFFMWDASGRLQDIYRPCNGNLRHHWWNEADQLTAVVDNGHCAFYGYDGNGDRAYKLTGVTSIDQYNAGQETFHMHFNDAVLYVNPYFVVTPKGYTKHYYNGSQRIAAQIGQLENLPNDIIDTSAVATERIANACAYIQSLLSPDIELQPDTTATFVDIDGDMYDELQWQCTEEDLAWNIEMQCDSNILLPILSKDTSHLDNRVSGIYYYHPDHLGSATWITNSSGRAVQFIHYMPFGEMWYNQQGSAYNERYKFTGKERDEETGYDYFGARYYVPEIPIWLSVDPLADKYPNISPYAYSLWNPVKYKDPNGRDVYRYDDKTGDFKLYQTTDDNFDQIGKFKYDRKTKEYKPRLNKDGSIKTYSDHLGNNDKIAKGILRTRLNIKQNGSRFMSDNANGPSLTDFYNFALILDEVAGVEISGYVLENSLLQKGQRLVQFEPYKNNSYKTSSNRLYNSFGLDKPIIHFHTHGHAGYNEAITPSDNLDIPFKNKIIPLYPDIQLLILHNYGTPIKY